MLVIVVGMDGRSEKHYYGDLDNKTGTCPGYRVYIIENDGGISLQMHHADKDPSTAEGNAVFMTTDKEKEMYAELGNAINRALSKRANHPPRGIIC